MTAESVDEALHAVMAIMPPNWRFKGLYLASRPAQHRRVGWWYAQAVGPDPGSDRMYGLTGEGGPGVVGAAKALRGLATRLEDVALSYEGNRRPYILRP